MLVNGVEIINYKTTDKVYYGPVKEAKLFNGGTGYDVINPPSIEITSAASGFTTALVRPVIRGSVSRMFRLIHKISILLTLLRSLLLVVMVLVLS